MSKFAPITSSLLVRKGEAAPSPMTPPTSATPPVYPRPVGTRLVTVLSEVARRKSVETVEPRYVYVPEEPAAVGTICETRGDADKPRRIVLNLTAHEYETLGLVAIKKGSSRHLLAQAALDAYFEWLVAEYGEACNCIVGGALCRCECTH
jgi:hypothetical protein